MQTTASLNPPAPCSPFPPAFTDQDEQQEIATLRPNEIVSAEADLRGIASGLAAFRIGGGGGDEEHKTKSGGHHLRRLDAELAKMPSSQRSVYDQAVAKCPEMVTDEHRVAFLERDGFDARLAAERIVNYWDTKLSLFGPEKCFLPLTLSGAMRDEKDGMLKYSPFQILPVRDTAGRAIVFYDPCRRDSSLYSTNSAIMAFWYMVEAAAEDPEVRKKGIVVLGFVKNSGRKNFDPVFAQFTGRIFWDVSPIARRSVHVCHPSAFVYYVVNPIMKRFIGKETRLRLKMHYGTTEKVLQDLEGYCLPRDRLPSEMGGDVVLDLEKWLNNRLVFENGGFLPCTTGCLLEEEEANATTTSGRGSKRMRNESRQAACEKSGTAIAGTTVPSIQSSLRLDAKNSKRPSGRKADPRMNGAVMAKLAHSNMSLFEALVAGGFTFADTKTNGWVPDHKIFGKDNVSLKQRKNQLNRRLRQAKKNTGKETLVCNDTPLDLDGPVQRAGGASHAAVNALQMCEANDAGEEKVGLVRRDSFYDCIVELPGIEDLPYH